MSVSIKSKSLKLVTPSFGNGEQAAIADAGYVDVTVLEMIVVLVEKVVVTVVLSDVAAVYLLLEYLKLFGSRYDLLRLHPLFGLSPM